MAQTVIGIFDNSSEAQRAVQQLVDRGISRERIDLSSGRASASGVGQKRDDDCGRSGISEFFRSLFGGDNDEADRYSRVSEGSEAIVTVHARSREEAETAAGLLDSCGAVDVDERSGQYGFPSTGDGKRERTEQISIPRVEENLEVGKSSMETGGVRLRSRIVERPVEEHVRLREEKVHVERNQVNRPATEQELQNFQNADIELTERAEVPVVSKEARVVEEVRVSKEVEEHDETVRDQVRHTEIDLDRTGENNRSTGRSSQENTGRGLI